MGESSYLFYINSDNLSRQMTDHKKSGLFHEFEEVQISFFETELSRSLAIPGQQLMQIP